MTQEFNLRPGSPQAYSLEGIPFEPTNFEQITKMLDVYSSYFAAQEYYQAQGMVDALTPPIKTIDLLWQLALRLVNILEKITVKNIENKTEYSQELAELQNGLHSINEQSKELRKIHSKRIKNESYGSLNQAEASIIQKVRHDIDWIALNLMKVQSVIVFADGAQELSEHVVSQTTYSDKGPSL